MRRSVFDVLQSDLGHLRRAFSGERIRFQPTQFWHNVKRDVPNILLFFSGASIVLGILLGIFSLVKRIDESGLSQKPVVINLRELENGAPIANRHVEFINFRPIYEQCYLEEVTKDNGYTSTTYFLPIVSTESYSEHLARLKSGENHRLKVSAIIRLNEAPGSGKPISPIGRLLRNPRFEEAFILNLFRTESELEIDSNQLQILASGYRLTEKWEHQLALYGGSVLMFLGMTSGLATYFWLRPWLSHTASQEALKDDELPDHEPVEE